MSITGISRKRICRVVQFKGFAEVTWFTDVKDGQTSKIT